MPQGGPGIRVLPCQCFRHAELSQELSLAQEACGGRLSRALAANSISPVDPEDGECGTRAQGNHALSHPFEQRTHCELGDSDPFNPHRNAAASYISRQSPLTREASGAYRAHRQTVGSGSQTAPEDDACSACAQGCALRRRVRRGIHHERATTMPQPSARTSAKRAGPLSLVLSMEQPYTCCS
ncbi:hypothetical protein PYCCODRAFT_824180 [Trametes coccinea BRFM310]|uniref:Uncharacterized protein n=1 Tax=Trametes coccinea (strain BRFM310) TaxID=1353009 RepID=A0A1Y2IIB0_TRAC3|nr:hypothetical protein PYCCODRAFT_824180 [Trametes coccinea BRFM310]